MAAFLAAIVTCYFFPYSSQWLMLLAGHLAATLIVFLSSQVFRNSSLYDPFWSVVPLPIALYLSIYPESGKIDLEKIILINLPIIFWSIRLTSNWARDWKGLPDEDFRYVNLKRKPFSFFIDLFGIHIYPTLQVNLSLLPIYFALSISISEVNIYLYVASVFTFLAVVLETIADEQMRIFRRTNSIGLSMQKGLWAYSRHPNYLGEILFWWGLYLMTLSVEPDLWYLFVCPLVMNLMFSLITCKMMDNRSLEKRPDYQEYMNSTRQLIIWKSVKKGE